MNVLFLLIKPPELHEYSDLYSDLVLEFAARGHQVHVAVLLEASAGRDSYCETIRGIRVLHVKCGNLFGVGPLRKGLTTLFLPRRFNFEIHRFFGEIRFDLIVYPTPPITFAPVVRRLKREHGCGTYLILRDIFPQNARDLRMIKDPLTFAFFRRCEQQLYDISDFIGCMSQGNIDYVRGHNRVDPAKLEILPNWQRTQPQPPSNRHAIRAKFRLGEKFVAVFGGNIGFAQDLGFLLELAKLYKSRDEIIFLIVGKGAEKPRIAAAIAAGELSNVMMMDHVSRADFDELLAACDVGLINLDRRFTIPNIPSKTLAYFAAAIPVLAAVDRHTDYGKYLEECDAGRWSVTGNLQEYRQNFERLLNDAALRKRLGDNGRRALLTRFTVESAFERIMQHFPG
ncbi:MAG TPA: glycosyltransferase family 4 protein [Tepidisphaeraceae bacterium]|jgi:glycosyltransferase involved in cell wall biosynthesis|nr:glycosyltransferase family 4 protein [Tepidisphaeraceae bacterium]